MAVTTMIGAKIHRREDPRLITGRGRYVDDMQLNGMLHVGFVRSPYGHARIKSIDITDAAKAPGVAAVYTARDFEGVLQGAMPVTISFVPDKKQPIGWAYIAKDEARYHGEIVAVVVAQEKAQAADAALLPFHGALRRQEVAHRRRPEPEPGRARHRSIAADLCGPRPKYSAPRGSRDPSRRNRRRGLLRQ